VARIGGNRNEYRILTGGWVNTKERSECGWEDDAITDLIFLYIWWKGVDWINLAQDRVKCPAVRNTATKQRVS
jgi:hypothetical protein